MPWQGEWPEWRCLRRKKCASIAGWWRPYLRWCCLHGCTVAARKATAMPSANAPLALLLPLQGPYKYLAAQFYAATLVSTAVRGFLQVSAGLEQHLQALQVALLTRLAAHPKMLPRLKLS